MPLFVLAVALSTGLYTTHVFVPPTPGPLAAAAALGADVGQVLVLGLVVSIPTAAAGLLWALCYARRFGPSLEEENSEDLTPVIKSSLALPPSSGKLAAFAPLIVPIVLIAMKSLADYLGTPNSEASLFVASLRFIGHPVMALLIGVILSLALTPRTLNATVAGTTMDWVSQGLQSAGAILLITGAGGAFGNILRATGMGNSLAEQLADLQVGIFLPFLLAAVLKTAQGSSTVAIITTAELISPLLEPLELTAPAARALVVLAIGAGSMTVSHLNDSYFWVVAQFSGMDTATALRCHTLATLLQGVVGIATIAVLVSWLV